MNEAIRLEAVHFAYASMPRPLFDDVTCHIATGWTGVVGANGAGKTTLLHLLCGLREPDRGVVTRPSGSVSYCEQRTDDPPAALRDFLAADDISAWQWKARLSIQHDWYTRWTSLSHGERKRAQIGTALWAEPAVLAVDEPTNHLDHDARDALFQALRSYRGVGLLVSHDREMLDELCFQCVFCNPPSVVVRSGGITKGLEQSRHDQEHSVRDREKAKAQVSRLEAEAVKRRALAAKQQSRRSKRGLGKGDNDERFKRNTARYSGKDGTGGRLLKQMEGRVDQAHEAMEGIEVEKTYASGIWPPGSRSPKSMLFSLASGRLHLGDERYLEMPDLTLRREDRIAVTGPNGAGKSTLIRKAMSICSLPDNRVVYVPQEIGRARSREILEETKRLPKDQLGRAMMVISRLNSRPERLLQSETPSPGETRKLLMALGIAKSPYLIVLDEPTNHLDLPSISSLESALADCPCGLLFVSHDSRFVDALANRRWIIEPRGDAGFGLGEDVA